MAGTSASRNANQTPKEEEKNKTTDQQSPPSNGNQVSGDLELSKIEDRIDRFLENHRMSLNNLKKELLHSIAEEIKVHKRSLEIEPQSRQPDSVRSAPPPSRPSQHDEPKPKRQRTNGKGLLRF